MPNSVIVYTVVAEFAEPATRQRYVEWLRDGHALSMVRDGGALSAEVTVLDDENGCPGGTVEARYLFASRADFESYQAGPAIQLGAERDRQFPPHSDIRTVRTIGVRAVRMPD